MLKPWWLVAFFFLQAAFVLAGLGIVYWTMLKWDADERLDAIFGAGLGIYAFLLAWYSIRRWVRAHLEVFRKVPKDFEAPLPH